MIGEGGSNLTLGGLNPKTFFGGGEEMQKQTWGFIFAVVGIIILLISLFADLIGIGGYPGLGYKQIIGIIVGVLIIIIGLILHRKS